MGHTRRCGNFLKFPRVGGKHAGKQRGGIKSQEAEENGR
jgi:hypothetical protein